MPVAALQMGAADVMPLLVGAGGAVPSGAVTHTHPLAEVHSRRAGSSTELGLLRLRFALSRLSIGLGRFVSGGNPISPMVLVTEIRALKNI